MSCYAMRSSTWLLLCASGVLCSLAAIAVYWNTLKCGIVYDDEPAIKKNKDLRPEASWQDLLFHDFWGAQMTSKTSHKSYRPLCVATFRLNYLLHELQPMGYHLVNVLLHGAVCYLYVQLCGVVFSGAVWPALIAGLLFAVHPIHTEAVAGLVGRTELLSGLFYTASFLFYHKSAVTQNVVWMLAVVACSLCAVLSKEQGITVVAVCVIYDFFVIQKGTVVSGLKLLWRALSAPRHLPRWFKQFIIRVAILAVFSVSFLVLRVWLMQGGPDIFNRNINPPLYMDTPYRQLSWLYLTFVNAWLLLNPAHLCPDWRFGLAPLIHSVTDPHNLLSLVTLVGVATLAAHGLKPASQQSRTLLVCLALTVVPFLPASNLFFPVGFVVAERVLYLPSMGFCMLVAYGCWSVLQKVRKFNVLSKLVQASVGLLLLVHSMKTVSRNRDWYSHTTFDKAGVKFNPINAAMLSNLGIDHAVIQEYGIAEQLYATSMRVAPDYSSGYYNYGKLMKITRRYQEAEWPLQKAIELSVSNTADRNIVDSYDLLASVISMNDSRLPEALAVCDQAISLYPNVHQLLATKCGIMVRMNQSQEAVALCEASLRGNSYSPVAYYNLGMAYLKLNRINNAESALWNSVMLDSSNREALYHLATILQGSSNPQQLREAQKLWLRLISLEPHNLQAMLNLAQVFADLQKIDQSLAVLQRLLEHEPDHVEALYRAGLLLYRTKQFREAAITLRKVVNLQQSYRNAWTLLSSAEKQLGSIPETLS